MEHKTQPFNHEVYGTSKLAVLGALYYANLLGFPVDEARIDFVSASYRDEMMKRNDRNFYDVTLPKFEVEPVTINQQDVPALLVGLPEVIREKRPEFGLSRKNLEAFVDYRRKRKAARSILEVIS